MPTDQTEVNPYASPQAELHASPDAEGPREPNGFRWRLIPAAFLMIFGGTMVLLSFGLTVAVLVVWVERGFPLLPKAALRLVEAMLVFGFGGALWIYSARAWWRRRWWRAILTTILGYVFVACWFHLRV